MVNTKQHLLIFIPALLIVCLALFIRYNQYTSLTGQERQDQTQESADEFTIPIFPGDPILGNKQAGHTIVAFEDYGCSTCKTQHGVLKQLLATHPQSVKIIWKGLPVTRFPHNTRTAHEIAFCAHEENKFDSYADLAFANSENLSAGVLEAIIERLDMTSRTFQECRNSDRGSTHVSRTETLARALNIQSVPAIFIDNIQVESPQTVEGWEQLLGL